MRPARLGPPTRRCQQLASFSHSLPGDTLRLSSASQAGLVNNLNDGVAWGLFPLFFAAAGLGVADIGWLIFIYPFTWGVLQLWTGAWSDRVGRKRLIAGGMLIQALALGAIAMANGFVGCSGPVLCWGSVRRWCTPRSWPPSGTSPVRVGGLGRRGLSAVEGQRVRGGWCDGRYPRGMPSGCKRRSGPCGSDGLVRPSCGFTNARDAGAPRLGTLLGQSLP